MKILNLLEIHQRIMNEIGLKALLVGGISVHDFTFGKVMYAKFSFQKISISIIDPNYPYVRPSVKYNVESDNCDQKVPTSILNMLILCTFLKLNNCLIFMNFGIIILRKINFDIIYILIFAATLYL